MWIVDSPAVTGRCFYSSIKAVFTTCALFRTKQVSSFLSTACIATSYLRTQLFQKPMLSLDRYKEVKAIPGFICLFAAPTNMAF
jgi:hypothetical protein